VETPRDILIVDDDRQVRDVLHQIFLSAGYTCHLAEDGPNGLEVFTAARPPLVVTDLKMPGMSGIELLAKIRRADQDAAVIVLTGAADVKTAIDSLKLGAYDFIMKPVNVEELLIAADRALERRQLLIDRRAYQELLESRVDQATRDLSAAYHELEETYRSTLEALGSALDTRDIGTEAHSRRRARLRARDGACLRRRSGDDARPGSRRPPARHRQDRHSRCHPPEARSADARGMGDHAQASGHR